MLKVEEQVEQSRRAEHRYLFRRFSYLPDLSDAAGTAQDRNWGLMTLHSYCVGQGRGRAI